MTASRLVANTACLTALVHIQLSQLHSLTYLMAQDGLMHQPSIAVQLHPRITSAPHPVLISNPLKETMFWEPLVP